MEVLPFFIFGLWIYLIWILINKQGVNRIRRSTPEIASRVRDLVKRYNMGEIIELKGSNRDALKDPGNAKIHKFIVLFFSMFSMILAITFATLFLSSLEAKTEGTYLVIAIIVAILVLILVDRSSSKLSISRAIIHRGKLKLEFLDKKGFTVEHPETETFYLKDIVARFKIDKSSQSDRPDSYSNYIKIKTNEGTTEHYIDISKSKQDEYKAFITFINLLSLNTTLESITDEDIGKAIEIGLR